MRCDRQGLRRVMAVLLIAVLSGDALAQAGRSRGAQASPMGQAVAEESAAILTWLEAEQDHAEADRLATRLFDQVIAHAHADDVDAFRVAAFTRRLVRQLERADGIDRSAMLAYLNANPNLARAVVFGMRPENRPADVYALLDKLRTERGEQLDAYANLAAAICLVHERPLQVRVNENTVGPPAPLELFDYYVRNERHMFFGVKEVPVELLVYVVDIGASIEEMNWALREHRGHRQIGGLFHTIRYDHAHYRRGEPKQVTVEGFNLPNIQRFGGVCADQAHYACTVGKAIGVPAVYARGRGGQVSHAWVGFLEQQGPRNASWNFNHGRYSAYQGVRGVTRDPQTRQWVDDSYVSLLAELIGSRAEDRHAAAAFTDATVRLHAIAHARADWPVPPLLEAEDGGDAPSPRGTDIDARLDLLRLAMRATHGHLPAWLMLGQLAGAGEMSVAQKRAWSQVVLRLCGKYPDFAVTVLRPMIRTIDDPAEQHGIWDEVLAMFRRRHDLAAEIRMEQGRLWEEAGDARRAGQCYEDVISRYANAGPFVLEAVTRAEAMLVEADLADRVPQLYERTWSSIHRPRDVFVEFQRQSNWYQLGVMYVEKLEELGHLAQAQRAEAVIGREVGEVGR